MLKKVKAEHVFEATEKRKVDWHLRFGVWTSLGLEEE